MNYDLFLEPEVHAALELREDVELRRVRMERWRIVYAVCDEERWMWVLAVRRRPPYGYADLAELIARLPPK